MPTRDAWRISRRIAVRGHVPPPRNQRIMGDRGLSATAHIQPVDRQFSWRFEPPGSLAQALKTSASDSHIQFTVQDTTVLRVSHGEIFEGKMSTDAFTIADGHIEQASIGKAHTMSDPKNLAQFVAHTLENTKRPGPNKPGSISSIMGAEMASSPISA